MVAGVGVCGDKAALRCGVLELEIIAGELDAAARAGEDVVLATVIAVEGSTYRRPGARLLVRRDGRCVGMVSGGCLESEIARQAFFHVERGARVVTYDTSGDDEREHGYALGCRGLVSVLVEPVDAARSSAMSRKFRSVAKGDDERAIVVVHGGSARLGTRLGDEAEREGESSGAAAGVLMDRASVPERLVIFGGGQDAEVLARLAPHAGFVAMVVVGRESALMVGRLQGVSRCVTGTDPSVAEWLSGERSAAAVMTHHVEADLAALRMAFAGGCRYVGLLGPASRRDELVGSLRDEGVRVDASRLYAPAGLDIGSEGAGQIALAILAEARAVLHGRGGGMLRERKGAIHEGGAVVGGAGCVVAGACPIGGGA